MMKKLLMGLLTVYTTVSAVPQAIVFDFGGVMTGEPNREVVVQFLRKSFSLSEEEFEKVNQEKRKAIKLGKTDLEFWLQYAKETQAQLPMGWVRDFNQVMIDAIGVNPQMYTLVAELKKKGIPVALLSNIDDRLAKLLKSFGLYEPFSPCLLSCEIGVEKPDPKAYKALLKEIKLPPQDIVFIDDRPENIAAAKQLGFDAILFLSQEQLQKELEKRGLF